MRGPPWWLAALAAATVVFAGGAYVALQSPAGYLHPDEQFAGIPAQRLAGTARELPEELRPLARYFVPHGTRIPDTETGVSTGLFSMAGIGFGYPLMLAPFYKAGPQAPYLLGAAGVALLYLGALLVLDGRRPISYPLAALALAIPPVWLQLGLLFSNLPALGFCVLGLGLLVEAWRARRPFLVAPGMLSVAVAAAVRVDYLVAFVAVLPLALVALLPASGPGRRLRVGLQWGAGVALCLVVGLAVFALVNGAVGLPYLQDDSGGSAGAFDRVARYWTTAQEESDPRRVPLAAENYLFAFVPFLAAAGFLYLLRPSGRPSPAWALLPLMAQGLAVWLTTSGVRHYGVGCQCVDASHARYFMPIYVALALLAALALQDALGRVRRASLRGLLAVSLAVLVVVPAIVHAHEGEQGIHWIRERKAWHAGFEESARQLPEDAVLLGNYLSKIVESRPVIAASRVTDYGKLVSNVTYAGHRVYVSPLWTGPAGDEGRHYGRQLLRSGHHYYVEHEETGFYEIRVTNATVRQVHSLRADEWEPAPDRRSINATAEHARFHIVERPNGTMPQEGPLRARARITFTWYDDQPGRIVRIGHGDVDANATVDLGAWRGTGRGNWITSQVVVPAGKPLGELYVAGKPTLRRLEVTWL